MTTRLLGNRYELRERLHAGPFTETHQAIDRQQVTHVLVETLAGGLANDRASVVLFEQAFQVASTLDHPNIASVSPAQEADGQPFVIRAVPQGQTLGGLIATEGPLAPERAARQAMAVASALVHAHHLGATHGALSPASIYIGPGDVVTVTGFGLGARTTGGLDPRYTPPERAGEPQASPGTDLYSLGGCLHLMLTGMPPDQSTRAIGNEGHGAMASLGDWRRNRRKHRRQDQELDQPATPGLTPLLPPEMYPIVMRLLAKDPNHRYRSAAAVIEDLQQLANQQPATQPNQIVPLPPPGGDPDADRVDGPGIPADDDRPPAWSPGRILAAAALALPIVGIGILGTAWLGGDGPDGGDTDEAVETLPDDEAAAGTTTTESEIKSSRSTTTSTTTTTTTTIPPTTAAPATEPPITEPTEPPTTATPTTVPTTQPPTTTTEQLVRVPDVVYWSEREARSQLESDGFSVHVEQVGYGCWRGYSPVEAQRPQGGRRAPPGSTVNLTVRCPIGG